MGLDFKYASHIPVMARLLSVTRGDVLELGMGYYSTPFLHWLCVPSSRMLVSYDNDSRYYYKVASNACEYHKMFLIDNWDDARIDVEWDVVLVDHAPSERRIVEIRRLANLAKYIVIHDTYWKEEKHYHYKEIWDLFKYRFEYKVHCQTTVVSNFYNFDWMSI